MAYNPDLADMMRNALNQICDYEEFRMFGGVAFKVNTHMIGGVGKDDAHLRLGEDAAREALDQDGFSEMDFTGRSMKGWASMSEDAWRDEERLKHWLQRAAEFAQNLPLKKKKT